jgi:hypothetical protein
MVLQFAQSHQFLINSDFSFKSYKFSVDFDIPGLGTDGGRTAGPVAPPRANVSRRRVMTLVRTIIGTLDSK